jgi:hypothetical protein
MGGEEIPVIGPDTEPVISVGSDYRGEFLMPDPRPARLKQQMRERSAPKAATL